MLTRDCLWAPAGAAATIVITDQGAEEISAGTSHEVIR